MFKYIFLIFAFFVSFNHVFSQGKVSIIAEDKVVEIENTRLNRRKNADVLVQGYRIFIGMTSARADAVKLQSDAQEKLGESFTPQVVYDEPNFKIYVGSFHNSIDADEAMAEIKKHYPNAKKIKMPVKIKK
jgi:hypothetical protein